MYVPGGRDVPHGCDDAVRRATPHRHDDQRARDPGGRAAR